MSAAQAARRSRKTSSSKKPRAPTSKARPGSADVDAPEVVVPEEAHDFVSDHQGGAASVDPGASGADGGARASEPSPSDGASNGAAGEPTTTVLPDPVPQGVRSLIELFGRELEGVRFPDVDRDVLEASAQAVRAADAEVARLVAALEAAQVRLTEGQAELDRLAQRGLAYAHVFATDDPTLTARLDDLDLGNGRKGGRKTKPKSAKAPTRGRSTRGDSARPPRGPGTERGEDRRTEPDEGRSGES